MNFSIAPEILKTYPTFRVIILTAENIQVSEYNAEIDRMLDEQQDKIKNSLELAALPEHPHIREWRKTYASFGAKPSKYRCAAESLLRTVLKRGSLPRINSLVDLCNFVAIKHVIPIDAMDTLNLKGNVRIKFAQGDEPFLPLGARELDNPPQGEVIYCDDQDVLGRRWNWRKCDKNKVTGATKNILCTVEGIGNISTKKLTAAADELGGLLQKYFDCDTKACFYDASNSRAHAS